ncbi:hypothetical protein [Chitinophaga sp. CF418]|uniref:hypothetical protein n=1 Tax=Chitinophaga sp. CF418 TaxID=1855287 RepID=UPI0009239DB7|nr:hypothetical protein [Chitinophaga sp. CF418]SHM83764.1 hypothetical protein SAMN05216311_103416 [Chitinophaga sp. CF418]
MKKAKLALVAIALFAVAGGAFAFKVKRASDKVYITTVAGARATSTILGATTLTTGDLLGTGYITTQFNQPTPTTTAPYYEGL